MIKQYAKHEKCKLRGSSEVPLAMWSGFDVSFWTAFRIRVDSRSVKVPVGPRNQAVLDKNLF